MKFMRSLFGCILPFAIGFSRSFVILDDQPKKSPDDFSSIYQSQSLPIDPLYFNVILPPNQKRPENIQLAQGLLEESEDIDAPYPTDVMDSVWSLANETDGATMLSSSAKENGIRSRVIPGTTLLRRKNPNRWGSSHPVPAPLQRRGLADTGLLGSMLPNNPFDTGREDKTGIFISPGTRPDSPDQGEASELYNYTFVGESFELNGTAKITYDEDKIRITFEYTITGNGNATAHLVAQGQEVMFPPFENNGISSALPRPDSCHPQASENRTKKAKPCQATTRMPRDSRPPNVPQPPYIDSSRRFTGGVPLIRPGRDPTYPLLGSRFSFLSSSLMSPYGPSTSESYIFPRDTYFSPFGELTPTFKNYDDVINKDCDVTVTTYSRKWLCIGRTEPPCFMLVMYGTKYKVAKKICPRRVFTKKFV